MNKHTVNFSLTPHDNRRLAKLCGQCDEHLRQVEDQYSVKITNRGNEFKIVGDEACVNAASLVLNALYQEASDTQEITPDTVHLALQENKLTSAAKNGNGKAKNSMNGQTKSNNTKEEVLVHTKKGAIKARTSNQKIFVDAIQNHAVNFGIGPAGTGKTYLAVACAVLALEKEEISRILLVRPVVEAGENLGFLPGDFVQKIDPYLRPLYDALNEMLGNERVQKLLEKNVIEIAPLAYMRGRTLNDSFIILDESQNCTKEQMKMFLTRIGFGSTAVITGDITQVDLPRGKYSGLRHAMEVLSEIKGISFTYFNEHDVVRHPLIESIVRAYTEHEKKGAKKA